MFNSNFNNESFFYFKIHLLELYIKIISFKQPKGTGYLIVF